MAYTSVAKIERDKALAEALRGNYGQEILPNWASGLAYVLNQYGANKRDKRATAAAEENDRLRTAEMGQLAAALRGGTGVLRQGELGQYSHPDVQSAALAQQLKASETENEYAQKARLAQIGGNKQYAGVPIVDTANGNFVVGYYQPTEMGAPKAYAADGSPLAWKDTYAIGNASTLNLNTGVVGTVAPADASRAGMIEGAKQAAQTQGAADRLRNELDQRTGNERTQDVFSADLTNLNEAYKSVQSTISNVSAIERLMSVNDFADEGTLAPLENTVKGIFASFGVNIDNLADNAVLNQAIDGILANYMSELGARGLTDRDMEVLRNNLPRMNQSSEARAAVASVLKSSYRKTLENYEEQRKTFAAKYGDGFLPMAPSGFDRLKNIGSNQNVIRYDAQGNRLN
jgi:hypothetical protein